VVWCGSGADGASENEAKMESQPSMGSQLAFPYSHLLSHSHTCVFVLHRTKIRQLFERARNTVRSLTDHGAPGTAGTGSATGSSATGMTAASASGAAAGGGGGDKSGAAGADRDKDGKDQAVDEGCVKVRAVRVWLSGCLSACLPVCLSLSVRLSVSLSVCLSVSLSVCLSVSLQVSVRLSVCPSVRLSICPSVHLSICPCAWLSTFVCRQALSPSLSLSRSLSVSC
jgi:hypothetical protein